ncbi:MAG: hypothetical protein ABF292_15510 [Desulfobacterales bacterium]
MVANSRLHIVAQTGIAEVNYPHEFKDIGFLVHRILIREDGKIIAVLGLDLFDSAHTASRLAEELSLLESKLRHAAGVAALRRRSQGARTPVRAERCHSWMDTK